MLTRVQVWDVLTSRLPFTSTALVLAVGREDSDAGLVFGMTEGRAVLPRDLAQPLGSLSSVSSPSHTHQPGLEIWGGSRRPSAVRTHGHQSISLWETFAGLSPLWI